MILRLALVVVVALGVAGCAADDPKGPLTDVVVGVRADGCGLEPAFGTGVAVLHDGQVFVVTSAHTLAGAQRIHLQRDSVAFPATLIGFDPERDLAILRTPTITIGRRLETPSAGVDATAVVWSPDDGLERFDTAVTRLLRVTIEDIYVEATVERRAFEFEAEITAGDSGAPVFDDDGNVLGVIYARSRKRGVGFAVSTTEILPLLDAVSDEPVDSGRCT